MILPSRTMPTPAAAIDHQRQDGQPQQPVRPRRSSRRAPCRCRSASSRPVRAGGGPWRRNSAHKAGDSVSAMIADSSIDMLMVTANWRNNVPDRPGNEGDRHEHRQQHQRDRDHRPGDLRHRLLASPPRGERSGSSAITRSTFSTTTIASSTTTPMPSTIASSEIVLAEKPKRQQHREGADQADRDGDHRDDRRAHAAQEDEDHRDHQRRRRSPASSPPRRWCRKRRSCCRRRPAP